MPRALWHEKEESEKKEILGKPQKVEMYHMISE